MDFVIAIPSYNRLKQIQNLLLYLDDNNIIHNNIYIFIDPRNYWDYKKELEDKNYNLIIGKKHSHLLFFPEDFGELSND